MNHLAVFAKVPEPGKVKTRLSPALPPALACDFYRAMLDDTLTAAGAAEADRRYVFWDGARESEAARETPGFESRLQHGSDLGERLARAFAELLDRPGDRAVVIGADCPELGAERIAEAFRALETHDLALGPTFDGGYYLIGLARFVPALFEGIPWSTAAVLGRTLERVRDAGLRHALLGELADLDTPRDLVAWLARCAADGSVQDSATARALRAMKLLPEKV